MEGANCQTSNEEASKVVKVEMVDSGCEPSPTSPLPSEKSEQLDSKLSISRKVYEREFLLHLQFSPLALNPSPDDLLWPDYDNSPPQGIFNANHCYYTKSQQLDSKRKVMLPEYFKPMLESSTDVLRPQRKSFVSGCQMKASVNEAGDKSGAANKPSTAGQRRVNESKDRPRSVPTADRSDRRVGSGRLAIERSDSRPDSRGAYQARDKPSRPQSNADKRGNWRIRVDEDENHANHRDGRDNDHRSNYHRSYQNNGYSHRRTSQAEAEPEWFTEDVSMSDTIELKGFDGHKEANEKPEKKAKKKPVKVSERIKPNIEQEVNEIAGELSSLSKSLSVEADPEKTLENMFDFDSFMYSMPAFANSAAADADATSSRFSRWFSKDDDSKDSHSLENLSTGLTELHVEAQVSSFIQDLLSPGNLSDKSDNDLELSAPEKTPITDGNRLLHMLQSSGAALAAATASKNVDKKEKSAIKLPDALTKLLASPAIKQATQTLHTPELPSKYQTVEELEADLKPTSRPAASADMADTLPNNKHIKNHKSKELANHDVRMSKTPSTSHSTTTESKNSEQDMSAFNKLVGMLQVTGELNKAVPKMPEVTNTETPNQLKKLLSNSSLTPAELAQVEHGSPILPSPRSQPQHKHTEGNQASQPSALIASAPPTRLSKTPPTSGMPTNFPNNSAMMPNPGMFPPAGGAAGLVNIPALVQQPTQSINLTAAMQASAFQGPVNPIIQQTINQRNKLPSPIMFGAQPPVHIVAPAPIHPMGSGQFQPVLGQPQPPVASVATASSIAAAMANQQAVSNNPQQLLDHMVSHPSTAMSKPQSATVSSMAFTPTSVIRKLASDKVDERQRQNINGNQLKKLLDVPGVQLPQQHQQTGNIRGLALQQQPQHSVTQQQSAQLMSMRPIVKSNNLVMAEQFNRQREQQNPSSVHHNTVMQPSPPVNYMSAQPQQSAPYPNIFQHMNKVNNVYQGHHMSGNMFPPPQHQSMNFSQSSSQHVGNVGNLQQQPIGLTTLPQPTVQSLNQQTNTGIQRPSISSLQSFQQQLAILQQAQQLQQQQQLRVEGSGGAIAAPPEKVSPDNIAKWFCAADLVNQPAMPLPNPSVMLKLEDIEH